MHESVHALHTQRFQVERPQRRAPADVPQDDSAVAAAAAQARAGARERLHVMHVVSLSERDQSKQRTVTGPV